MKKYSGFTLIEMLIVMGIIIILMAAGLAGGRFALQRANRIQKISAADNIEQALWGYYGDNRRFPTADAADLSLTDLQCDVTPETLLTTEAILGQYIDAGQFDGGADGTFWYYWGGAAQQFIVCTSLGGLDDAQDLGIYCTGNGIEDLFTETPTPADNVYTSDYLTDYGVTLMGSGQCKSNWVGDERDWE
jgi:prepilin-type N-terminal cleavage/methylation domain-containing protein